jgi:hypothetical protein
VIDDFSKHSDGICCVYNKFVNGIYDLAQTFFVSKKHVDILGHIFSDEIMNYSGDKWVHALYGDLNRIVKDERIIQRDRDLDSKFSTWEKSRKDIKRIKRQISGNKCDEFNRELNLLRDYINEFKKI